MKNNLNQSYSLSSWIPPKDAVAEQNLLGCIMQEPNLFVIYENEITEELFYEQKNKTIFNLIRKSIDEYKKVTLPTLTQCAKDSGFGIEMVKEFINYKSNADNNVYLVQKNISELQKLKKCRYVSEQLSKGLKSAINGDFENTLEHTEKAYEDINKNYTKNFDDNWEDDFVEWINTPVENGLPGVNTGINAINKHTGGWNNDDMIVIGARPGMGKTVSAVAHAYYAAVAGTPVAMVSVEVSRRVIISRLVSLITGIPYGQIIRRDLVSKQIETIINTGVAQIKKLPIFIYDQTNSLDIEDISQQLRFWKRKHNIGLIIIDYLQMLSDKKVTSSNEYELVTSVSKKIKRLQGTLSVPVIALCQLNRATEARTNNRPTIKDLRNSGQIEQDASVIIMLYRDDYYELEKSKSENTMFVPTNTIEYNCVKNRNGGAFFELLYCDVSKNRIKDISAIENQFKRSIEQFDSKTGEVF